MPYDLYGNYYKSALEANNAEMAQCAEINQRYNEQQIRELEQNQQYPNQELWQYVYMLEERIKALEGGLK